MKALKKLIALLLNCLSYFIPIRLYILCKSKIYNHWILRQIGIIPAFRPMISKGPTIIGDRVWIGDKATILPGVTIGESCIVAANTVVTKDIPPFSLVAGNPARIIKQIDGNI